MNYKCPICGNEDPRFIGKKNNNFYCRKCLSFSKKESDNISIERHTNHELIMPYSLTNDQQIVSDKLIEYVDSKQNILIHAVCGAGKTEIITNIVLKFLNMKCKVGIIIPRRDLVIEIGNRLKTLFPKTKFSFVYGGHTSDINGDVIIATAHQAFRFEKTFDLLIIDEIDAFPYKNNDLLNYFVKRSTKGPIISLSATPGEKDLKDNTVIQLFKRFHGFPIPIPKIIIANNFYLFYVVVKLIKKYQNENKPCFIYVPTIKEGNKIFLKLKRKFTNIIYVNSHIKNRKEMIEQIRKKHFTIVITTTILERGVTFENLQVIIFHANHDIFDIATILQITGRVGRKKAYYDGDVYLLANKKQKKFKKCIEEVKKYNGNL